MGSGRDETDRLKRTRRNPLASLALATLYLAGAAALAYEMPAFAPEGFWPVPLLVAVSAATLHAGALAGLATLIAATAIVGWGLVAPDSPMPATTGDPHILLFAFSGAAALLWMMASAFDLRSRRASIAGAQTGLAAAIFRRSGTPTLAVDPSGKIISANAALLELLGLNEDEIVGQPVDLCRPQDGQEDLFARLTEIERVGKSIFDARITAAGGRPATVLIEAVVVRDERGAPAYFIACVLDITARAQEEEALRTDRARMRVAQDVGGIGSWECDVATGAMQWSDNQERLFGLSKGTAPDLEHLLDLVHPEDREILQQDLDAVLAGERDMARDMRIRRPRDGREFWIHARGELIRDTAGLPSQIAGIHYDITERRTAEVRERLLHELADRIAGIDDLQGRADAAVQLAGEHLNVGRIVFRELDGPDGVSAIHRHTLGDIREDWQVPFVPVPGERRPREIAIGDIDAERITALTVQKARHQGIAALLSILLPGHDDPRAVIEVHCAEPRAWTAGDIALFTTIGQRIVNALEELRGTQALKLQAGRMDVVHENAPEGFAVLKAIRNEGGDIEDFAWETANRAIAALAGVERLAGSRLSEVAVEPDAFARYREVLSNGTTSRILMPRPRDRTASIEARPIEDGIVLCMRDVTAETGRIARLESEQRRLRTLAHASTHCVWHASDAGAMQSTGAWTTLTGQDSEAAEGFGWLSATHPDDRARALAAWTAALRRSEPMAISVRLQHASGGFRTVDLAAYPVFAEDGRVLEWIGSVTDRDEERASVNRLQDERRMMAGAIGAASAVVFRRFIPDGTLAVGEDFAALWGFSEPPRQAGELIERIHPDDRAAYVAAEERAAEGEGHFEREFRILLGPQEVRWIGERGRVNGETDGRPMSITGIGMDITRRRNTEEARRAQADRLRRAHEAGQIGAWEWNLRENGFSWSNGFRRIWGMSETTPTTYETLLSFIHPEDRARADREILEAIRAGETYTSEFRVLAPGDNARWVQISGAVVRDDKGEGATSLIGICVEITERKRIEHELRRLNAELQGAVERRTRERDGFFELSQDLFAIVGFDGYLKHINYAWEGTLGYSQARLLSRPFLAFMHREDRTRARAALSSLLAGESLPRLDVRGRRIDGEYRWFSITAVPADGAFYVVARDITAERQARMALREANQRLTAEISERERTAGELLRAQEGLALALEAARMGTFDYEIATGLVRRSARHDELFGFSEPQTVWTMEQAEGRILDEDIPAYREAMDEAMRTGILDTEWRVRWPDGGVHWLAAWGRTFYDAQGRPQRIAGVLLDTTDRRQTEAELRQAQKMEAVGQLTGGIAHDFNNLLTVVSGNLDLIIRGAKDSDRTTRLARSAETAAKRGARLIDQLLAFGRRQSLRPEIVDLNALMRDFSGLLHRAVGETIEISYEPADALWPIHVDSGQLEAAILNLAVNARDAMPEGGRLTIETANIVLSAEDIATARTDLEPGDYVTIRVSDTGQGIAPELVERVFEPFFTTKGVGRGSGLGLSQVYGFVRQSGGAIRLDSAPGEGTTIEIHLPRSSHAAANVARSHSPASDEPERGGETILVVEDDDGVRHVTVETLTDLGYRVLVATDGVEARRILAGDEPIDLLFTDIVMPNGVTGTMLARETMAARPEIRILLTSGYSADQHLEGGDTVAELPLLRKPFRTQDLARALRVCLEDAPAPTDGLKRLDVLVVEDDALVRLAAVDMLQSLGHVAFEAADAGTALALVEEGLRVDVLMSDIGLPDMDGTELAARLRAKRPDLPVVFATGYDEAQFDETARSGRTAFLGKPFTTNALSVALRQAVGSEGQDGGTAPGTDRSDAA